MNIVRFMIVKVSLNELGRLQAECPYVSLDYIVIN